MSAVFPHWEKTKDLIDNLLDVTLNYRQSGHPGGSRSKAHFLISLLLGGDWDLEYTAGLIESVTVLDTLFTDQYAFLLDNVNVGGFLLESTIAVLGGAAIGFIGAWYLRRRNRKNR